MHCMKCGKEIEEPNVFCESCLAVMSTRPVKPGTVIQLPTRVPFTAKKAVPRKRQRTPEEQLHRLRGAIKWMSLALTCLVLALALTISFLVHTTAEKNAGHEIGQNYNTVTPVAAANRD